MAVYTTKNTSFAATAGAKTVLKLIQPTSFNIKVYKITISADGITATGVPATFEWGTSTETTAGTQVGTAVTTQTSGRAQAHGLTVGQNFSAEGTTYTIQDGVFIPQFMGLFVLPFPLGLEPESPGDAAASFLLRVNVTANVNLLASIQWGRA